MPRIVIENVSQQVAPLPVNLQRMGTIISQGATILQPGTSSYLTQLSDLTPLLREAEPLSSLTHSGTTTTAVTASPHGFSIGINAQLDISGASPDAYNGSFYCTIVDPVTFTYVLTGSPTSPASVPGFYATAQTNLVAAASTFFAQGIQVGAYVLELGPGSPYDGIQALAAYLTANPNTEFTPGTTGFFYVYLLPPSWDLSVNAPASHAALLALVAEYESTTAKTYFIVTTTLSTYKDYTPQMKSVLWQIDTPQMAAYPQAQMVSISQAGGTVHGSTAAAHGVNPGDWFQLQGNTPAGYNGWWQATGATGGQSLVWNMPLSSPGSLTVPGFLEANAAVQGALPTVERQTAATMYDIISNRPSSSNKVPPLAYTFQFGVTPWPTVGLNSLLQGILDAGGNYVGTGSEGGISTATLFLGQTADRRDFLYWYAVDAAQLYSDANLANTIINGSNNRLNPLYYNQAGINRLQDSELATMISLASWGLANGIQIVGTRFPGTVLPGSNIMSLTEALDSGQYDGMIVVNAEPYLAYLTENPDDYRAGVYGGISVQFIPSTGFRQVILNLLVTDIITTA